MFTLPLNLLFIFAVTTPLIGYLITKYEQKYLCGVYPLIGIILAGYTMYTLWPSVSVDAYVFPPDITPFFAYFRIDTLSFFMAFIQIGLGFFITLYSMHYMEKDWPIPLYYSLLLSLIAGMVGVVFAGDMFTLFVFWELMCLSSYMLVAFRRERQEAIEAGLKYLLMSSVGSATFLYGISLIYGFTGSLHFTTIAATMGQAATNPWFNYTFLLIFIGLGIKAAIVPLHTWLPDAYSAAPIPVSAILSGIAGKTALYVMFRVFFTGFPAVRGEWTPFLAVFSIITMTMGNILAFLQTNLKRLLAYSSIAHVGYMLVGLAAGNESGLTGTFLHILNHGLMKSTAFLCLGAIIWRLGERDIEHLEGVGKKMPFTVTAFSISLLALLGMPGLNGFVGELILFFSTIQQNLFWLGIAMILNTAISAGYYLRIMYKMMQTTTSELVEEAEEVPVSMLVPIYVMTVFIVLFGIWPDLVLDLARQAAAGLLFMI